MKVVRIAAVVWGMVLLAATPAGAAPVVATDEKFWFYWVGAAPRSSASSGSSVPSPSATTSV